MSVRYDVVVIPWRVGWGEGGYGLTIRREIDIPFDGEAHLDLTSKKGGRLRIACPWRWRESVRLSTADGEALPIDVPENPPPPWHGRDWHPLGVLEPGYYVLRWRNQQDEERTMPVELKEGEAYFR